MFYSILFPTREQYDGPRQEIEPYYFKDLNLDLIFAPILTEDKGFGAKDKNSLGLDSFFYTPLHDPEIIAYRQYVMRDLEGDGLRDLIVGFVHELGAIESVVRSVHEAMTTPPKWRDNYLVRGQLLECTERYSRAVVSFAAALKAYNLRSSGLHGFCEYLEAYLKAKVFINMVEHAAQLRERLSTVEYCMHIKFPTIRVRQYDGQTDLAKDLLAVFSKFSQGGTQDCRHTNPEESQDFRMEATVLNMVAVYYKDIFMDLDNFSEKYYNFENEVVCRFVREIQFYLAWLALIAPLRRSRLEFCYPKMCDTADHLYSRGGFDLALAITMGSARGGLVTNDFELRAPERIIVITGPNQGGKTTFVRAFGQMQHLASLGLCVPGHEAALYLFDTILTHFEREEDLTTLSGKLQDDLLRLRELLNHATSRSIIVINEIFGSTTLTDALCLGKRMMAALDGLKAPAMVVTFLDELAVRGPETVSMMSTVDADDPARRTFKIVRKPPDGLAYAIHLAEKHGLTYKQVVGRLSK